MLAGLTKDDLQTLHDYIMSSCGYHLVIYTLILTYIIKFISGENGANRLLRNFSPQVIRTACRRVSVFI